MCDADGAQSDAERRFLDELKTRVGLDATQTATVEREAGALADEPLAALPVVQTSAAAIPGALEWFAAQRSPALDVLFTTVTWLGSLWLLLPLALALIVTLAVRGDTAVAARFTAAFGGAVAISYTAKLWVGRERPAAFDSLVSMPSDPSFPSGHAMQITAFALAGAWLLAPPVQRGVWLAIATAAILLVGTSRVYLQVHFPSDVLVGAAVAALWSYAFTLQDQTQEQQRHA